MARMTRREFLAAGSLAALAPRLGRAQELKAEPHTLTVIAGTPRERGRLYGKTFKDRIHAFLEREIYQAFTKKAPTRDEVLRYAGACAKEIRGYSPEIAEELEGMAEATGLRLEEHVLLTLHEELWHKGVIPEVEKCTAIAAGPPDTADGNTYVGQSWDWMTSVYGMSQMLHWKRPGGASVLAYAYPGLWTGAGMNSKGLSLSWTSGSGMGIAGPRVGIPSYVLIAQILYQDSLRAALEEARRAKHAGWFTFVLGDGEGNLANIEGTPRDLAIEETRGHMVRALYGSRKITGTAEGQPVKVHPRVRAMYERLAGLKGKLDFETMKGLYGSHAEGEARVCQHPSTIDGMVFNATKREAWLTRGPACSGRWKKFAFDER